MNPEVPSEDRLKAVGMSRRVADTRTSHWRIWPLVAAAGAIPWSLLWDFSWECTVGIDLPLGAPHLAMYAAVGLAALIALSTVRLTGGSGVTISRLNAPAGTWVILWGAAAFVLSVVFDRWWQRSYGLAAGIWHPPQLLKTAAFFAILLGIWIDSARLRDTQFRADALIAGALLAFAGVVTTAASLPNRQHSAGFYQIACGVYPAALIATAAATRRRFATTAAALAYTGIVASAVWLLPLIPGTPGVSPIYHPRDHLMPPPFPLLLIAPAAVIDLLGIGRRSFRNTNMGVNVFEAAEAALVFFLAFMFVQWPFASFLLSHASDNCIFAGGGRHWPFFLKIDDAARTAFWKTPGDELTFGRGLAALLLALTSSTFGLLFGRWLRRVKR
jgi:hypothetical protein